MQNYNESNISGTKHTRCYKIEVMNPHEDRQVAVFHEEDIHQIGDEQISKKTGAITIIVDNDKEVTHPVTGETMSFGELYQWMGAAYLQEALERDARASSVPEPELPETMDNDDLQEVVNDSN